MRPRSKWKEDQERTRTTAPGFSRKTGRLPKILPKRPKR